MQNLKFQSMELIKIGAESFYQRVIDYALVMISYASENSFGKELSEMLLHLSNDSLVFSDDDILIIRCESKQDYRSLIKTLKSSRTQTEFHLDVFNGRNWNNKKIKTKGLDKESVLRSYKWKP